MKQVQLNGVKNNAQTLSHTHSQSKPSKTIPPQRFQFGGPQLKREKQS